MNEATTYNSIGQLIEPEPIGYSFNTPGWYLVLALLLLTALVVGIFQYRKYRKNAYRREAVQQINMLVQQKNSVVVYEINRLLKVIALRFFGRRKVAALYGLEWFSFLQSTLNTKQVKADMSFDEFTKALYDKDYKLNENKENELIEFAILWVKNHHVNV